MASSAQVLAYYDCYYTIELYTGLGNSDTSPTPSYDVGNYSNELQNFSYTQDHIVLFNQGEQAISGFPAGFFLVYQGQIWFAAFDLAAPSWTDLDLIFPSACGSSGDFPVSLKADAYGMSRWGVVSPQSEPESWEPEPDPFSPGATSLAITLVPVAYEQALPRLQADIVSRIQTASADYQWRDGLFSPAVWSPNDYVQALESCQAMDNEAVNAAIAAQVQWFQAL